MKKLKNGFTIIEITIGIAIIGVLATIIVPKIKTEINKAKVSTVASNLDTSRSLIKAYYSSNYKYPDIDSSNKEQFRLKPTPAFSFFTSSNSIGNERKNNGGWYYDKNTGQLYANLPNGAYTGDYKHEIWGGEIHLKTNNKINRNNLVLTVDGNTPKTNLLSAPIIPKLPLAIDPTISTKMQSYMVGAGGQAYQYPYGTGKYVVDINPNVGNIVQMIPGAKFTGNYNVYVDDQLVSQSKGNLDHSHEIITTGNFRQPVSKNAQQVSVAFEYTLNGKTRFVFGTVSLSRVN